MDREKVIKGLEGMIDYFFDIYRNDTDSYKCAKAQEYSDCAIDAIALLKEQEAKPMIENEHGWDCPSCGMKLIGKTASGYPCDLIDLPDDEVIKFCPRCGMAVQWYG